MKRIMNRLLTSSNSAFVVVAMLIVALPVYAGEVLFVSDSLTDANNIPQVLSGNPIEVETAPGSGIFVRSAFDPDDHTVTIVRNDYQVTGGEAFAAEGTNPILTGTAGIVLGDYCAVFWSASGPHLPDTFGDVPTESDGVLPPADPSLDTDSDGVPDLGGVQGFDNCTMVPNGPALGPDLDQRDTNGDGFGNICDADLNNDGFVNAFDLYFEFRPAFPSADGDAIYNEDADFDGDGDVDMTDYMTLRGLYYRPPGPNGNPAPAYSFAGGGVGADGGLHTDPTVFDSLGTYVEEGGYVFVTGHDAIASPYDEVLARFVGGEIVDVPAVGDVAVAGSVQITRPNPNANPNFVNDGIVPFGGSLGGIVGASELVVGETTIGGMPGSTTPGGVNTLDGVQDLDGVIEADLSEVEYVVTDSIDDGSMPSMWTVRTPVDPDPDDAVAVGRIAYVANGTFLYEDLPFDPGMFISDGEDASWLTDENYNAALRNFAYNACPAPP